MNATTTPSCSQTLDQVHIPDRAPFRMLKKGNNLQIHTWPYWVQIFICAPGPTSLLELNPLNFSYIICFSLAVIFMVLLQETWQSGRFTYRIPNFTSTYL